MVWQTVAKRLPLYLAPYEWSGVDFWPGPSLESRKLINFNLPRTYRAGPENSILGAQ
jgi:hypothetical protein